LCPDADPKEKFTAWKHKLDECRETLGEDLYQLKLRQLTDEYLKASAMSHANDCTVYKKKWLDIHV
jgi:hypothetical protein